MVAGDCCEGDLRPQTIQTTRIIVACDYVRKRRGAIPAVIDDEHGVVAAATQADGNITRVWSSIAVPDVVGGIIVAGTIERRMGSVERQVRYVADGLCIIAVVVGRLTRPPTGTDANHALASLAVVRTDLDEIMVVQNMTKLSR